MFISRNAEGKGWESLLYRNRWRSWCIMRITELEGFVSWDQRLLDSLGNCSKHRLTITIWFSVLTDRGRPLRPLMLSCTFPIFLNLSRRRIIVSLFSAWKVPLKLSVNWFRREFGPYNLDPFLHEMCCCLIHWSWEITLWSSNYDLPGNQKLGSIWYAMVARIKWIHLFGPPCILPF